LRVIKFSEIPAKNLYISVKKRLSRAVPIYGAEMVQEYSKVKGRFFTKNHKLVRIAESTYIFTIKLWILSWTRASNIQDDCCYQALISVKISGGFFDSDH